MSYNKHSQEWITTAAGIQMPRLIYGTAWKKERTADLVETAVKAGFHGIDTACQPKHYNEPSVGDALFRLEKQGISRKNLFLQTKFTPVDGHDPKQIPYDPKAPLDLQVAQSFERSQQNLRTEYVDSLVLHSPLSTHQQLMKVWRAMELIQQSGGALQLGISNCYHLHTLKGLYQDAHVQPAVVQNRFYETTHYDIGLRQWCAEQGILYQSFWTLTANGKILNSKMIALLSQRYQKTQAQIFFRYLIQSGIVPLTGTCSERHMREDLDIFQFTLDSKDIRQLDRLFDPYNDKVQT